MARRIFAPLVLGLLAAGVVACTGGQAALVAQATSSPTATADPTPLGTPSPRPTARLSASPAASPTAVPTVEPTPSATATPTVAAQPEGALSAVEAGSHLGELATVCGTVASATYAQSSGGSPTFLNLERPYPDHAFTILIWSETRDSYSPPPEVQFAGKAVCVEGIVDEYQGVPQIEAGWGGVGLMETWE